MARKYCGPFFAEVYRLVETTAVEVEFEMGIHRSLGGFYIYNKVLGGVISLSLVEISLVGHGFYHT